MERVFLETKFATTDTGVIKGVAWPFGSPDRMGDEIAPGAFKGVGKSLPMLFAHDQRDTVGVWESVSETAKGLEVAGKLLVEEVQRAREVRSLVMAGAVRGLSIGFIGKSARSRPGGGRLFTAVELMEISLVAAPAHPGARVTTAKAFDPDRASELVAAIHRAHAALRV
jgi:HK97 family phage prohead protease